MAYWKQLPVVGRCVLGWCCLSIMGLMCPAVAATRSLAVQQVSLYQQNGLDGQPAFVVRASAVAENLAGQVLVTTVSLRREDGQPLRLGASSPPFYSEKKGAIVYSWSGPVAEGVNLNDLFALFPIQLISSITTPCDVIVRFEVKCGDLTAYLDARTSFPLPVPERTRLLQMGNLRVSLNRESRSIPNVAGMGVAQPNALQELEKLVARLDFAVGAMQGQTAYAGMVPRLADGGTIRPAADCPGANIGNGNRVQVQRSESVRINPCRWDGYQLEMPVSWMEVDRTTDRELVAGIYTSAAGLWGYGEVAVALPARVPDSTVVAVAPSNKTLSRYTVPLRDILIELQQVNRRLIALQNDEPEPDQGKVRACGQELARIGGTFKALCGDSATKSQTRIGLVEDLDLFQQIADVQEAAADRFMTMAVLPEEAREAMRPARPVGMLEQVGRELIEKEVTDWVTRKGFGDLLAENGQNQLGGKVSKRLQLDLKGYLNKKSMEVAGMPLRGFRSMQAALRLQARRKIRELVAELVVDFTGNRLVLMLLQNTILDWAENKLWPELREAFRPKGNLEYRVNISVGTMQQARRRLFDMSKGRDPGLIPLDEVLRELNRAAGTVHASRYLEKDLLRAGDDALQSRFNSELNNLTQAMRVVMGQFLLYEDFMSASGLGRLATLNDLSDHIMGIQEDVLYVLGRMGGGVHEMRIWHPASGELGDGRYRFKPEYFQQFHVALYKLPAEQLTGIKRLTVWIGNQRFVLYGVPDPQRKLIEFKGKLPMPTGSYTVRLACPDIAGVVEEELLVRVVPDDSSQKGELLGRTEQRIRQKHQQLSRQRGGRSSTSMHALANEYQFAAKYRLDMGDPVTAQSDVNQGIQLIMQSGSPYSTPYLSGLYTVQSALALLNNDRNGYLAARQQTLNALNRYAQYQSSHPGQFAWTARDAGNLNGIIANCAMDTAEQILEMGVDAAQAKPYVDLGLQTLSRSNQPTRSVQQSWPNVAVVFSLNR